MASVVGCNQQLLGQLEAKLASWTDEDGCVGKIFLGLVDYLKMYTMYINNYNMSVTSVTACKKKFPKFAKFLEVRLRSLAKRFSNGTHLLARLN